MTKAEQARVVAWRLKILRYSQGKPRQVARTCRHFGISRTVFYRWKRRFEAHGEAGLADRPRTPRRSPRATPPAVVSKTLYLRQQYHFGPSRIADYLRRFHQVTIARSSVHRILAKHGMRRLPANQKYQPHRKRWKRYEKPKPGHRLQMDVKFLERIPGTRKRLNQFTAIDDCTRIRVLKVYDACNQRSAIQFLNEVRQRLPFRIHVIQTDNGAEFQSQFHWHAEALDIKHVYIRPRTPRLNSKVERSHRVDDQEFYQLHRLCWRCMFMSSSVRHPTILQRTDRLLWVMRPKCCSRTKASCHAFRSRASRASSPLPLSSVVVRLPWYQ